MAQQMSRAIDPTRAIPLTFADIGGGASATQELKCAGRIIAGIEMASGGPTSITIQYLSNVDDATWINTGITLTVVAGAYRTIETASVTNRGSDGYGWDRIRFRDAAGGTANMWVNLSS